MRRLLVGATLVLVAGTTAACGGSPDDASTKDFCKALQSAPTDEKPSQDDIDDYADELEETGTPKEIKGDAREGFEIFVDALEDIDVDDEDALKDLEDEVGKDDAKKVEKFFAKAAEVCADQG